MGQIDRRPVFRISERSPAMAFDSLFTGVSGLEAYQNQIDVISNNIANVGSTGFKGQRVTFQDLLYQNQRFASAPGNASGGVNGQDVGLGVKIGSIDTRFTQGGLQTTGVNTDLAINGDGFFVLRKPNGNGSPVYTRDGAFSLNSNGLLYDPSNGLAVQGYNATAAGAIAASGTPNDITIPIGLKSQAVGTGLNTLQKFGPTGDQVFDMSFGGNLDQTEWIKEAQGVQAGAPGAGQKYVTSTTIYDSLGVAHQVSLTYVPDASGAAAGPPATNGLPTTVTDPSGQTHIPAARWRVQATFAATDGSTFRDMTGATVAAGTAGDLGYAYFDQNGQYINTSNQVSSGAALPLANTHNAGAAASNGAGDLLNVLTWGTGSVNNSVAPTGTAVPGAIGLGFSGLTSLSASASANTLTQNGYGAGILSNITIGQDGTVTGAFTNGQTLSLARVAVATFTNEGALQRTGSSQFLETANSGLAQLGIGGTGRFGAVVSGALEQSNVSIADEFTKMIAAQNAYQANSKSIVTASEDLQTVIGLIR